jgi:hypothetical protein
VLPWARASTISVYFPDGMVVVSQSTLEALPHARSTVYALPVPSRRYENLYSGVSPTPHVAPEAVKVTVPDIVVPLGAQVSWTPEHSALT